MRGGGSPPSYSFFRSFSISGYSSTSISELRLSLKTWIRTVLDCGILSKTMASIETVAMNRLVCSRWHVSVAYNYKSIYS